VAVHRPFPRARSVDGAPESAVLDEESVPQIRPFRALRYHEEAVDDLAQVVAPPYDVIGPDLARALREGHPKNAVRIDLPAAEPGEDPDERYRRAARTLAAWRLDGTLRKDPRPSVYVLEQTYRVPGTDLERTQRGFFGRLRLEPFGDGVLAHERTMSGPKEDRYRLLRATGINTSPVIGMYEDLAGDATRTLRAITGGGPTVEVEDAEGVRHRLWVVPDDGDPDGMVGTLVRVAGAGPVVIADGHHRYETALRYRDERRMTRSREEDPAFEYVLMLFLDSRHQALTVLPTHRVVLGLEDGGQDLATAATELFAVQPSTVGALTARFAEAATLPGGLGRFGLLTRTGGWHLEARRTAFEAILPGGGDAVRALDVTLLAAALERLLDLDAAAVASGERLVYTKSAEEAVAMVTRGDGDAAFLLEPTPVPAILAVARDGDVMPQKSTYFHPKALTGLLFNPHEW
jgi:uncharacterized protein (DUF1015 family)